MSEIERLRGLLAEATRVVIETDHVYREVGKIVALDVERREIESLPALLDVAEAARTYADFTHGNIRGPKYRARQEARDALDDALDRLGVTA
jgi:hypothetical protein